MTEPTEDLPYVYVLRNEKKQPLLIGAYGGSSTWEDGLRFMSEKYEWWDEAFDYLIYFFRTEKRAWEYAIHLVEQYAPIYQPTETDPDITPPIALLEAIVDPDPNPPKMLPRIEQDQ